MNVILNARLLLYLHRLESNCMVNITNIKEIIEIFIKFDQFDHLITIIKMKKKRILLYDDTYTSIAKLCGTEFDLLVSKSV